MGNKINKMVGVVIPQLGFCIITGFLVFIATILLLQGSHGAVFWIGIAGILIFLQVI